MGNPHSRLPSRMTDTHVCTPACITQDTDEQGRRRYLAHGFPVIGVTDLLKKIGLAEDSPFWTDEHRELGTAFHAGARILAGGGEIAAGSIDERLVQKLDCFRAFLDDNPEINFVGFEEIVCSPWPVPYAGRIDLRDDTGRIWELKGGHVHRHHRFQAWLYEIARNHEPMSPEMPVVPRPHVLYVTPQNIHKKYRIIEATQEDYDIVVGAIHVAKYKGVL